MKILVKWKRGSIPETEARQFIERLSRMGYEVVDVQLNPISQPGDIDVSVLPVHLGFFQRILGRI